jgi:hypothetical protein
MIKLFSLQEKKREEEKTGKKRVQSAQLRVQKGVCAGLGFFRA